MTLREEFENEIKANKGGISVLFETSNQHYIEWLECKVKNLSSNTVLADSKPRHCPKCNSTNVIMFDSDNDLCNDCGTYFC